MKFSSNFRPNSVSVNPHKLTPRANAAIRGENGNSSQAAGPVSPEAAEGRSEAEEEKKECGGAGAAGTEAPACHQTALPSAEVWASA